MPIPPPARSPAARPVPWRPGEYSVDAIKAHEGFNALPDAFPGAERWVGPPSLPVAGETPHKASKPIRATRRAAQWRESVYRAWGYLSGHARAPSHQAELDELLEHTLAAGPDFAEVRRNATFAPAPVVAYSREAAAEIMQQARQIERESYCARDKGEHGGALGRMALQLLEWFTFVLWPKSGRFGMVPSLAHIAAAARMSKATVVEAMKRLEAFGFLSIQRRRKRVPSPLGVKVVQDTNAYVLGLAKGLGALALAAFAKRPQAGGDKPAGGSEFRSPPAIKNEHFTPTPKRGDWLAQADFVTLLE